MTNRRKYLRQLSVKSMLVLTFLAGVFAAGFRNGYRDVNEFDRLIYLIQSTVAPDIWEQVGGSGSMAPYPAITSGCTTVVTSDGETDSLSGGGGLGLGDSLP